jgi:hypothetical protein
MGAARGRTIKPKGLHASELKASLAPRADARAARYTFPLELLEGHPWR